jgi:hypothetical protein
MPSKKNAKRRSKSTRVTTARTDQAAPGMVGDVPKRQPVDQSTSSIAVPRPTGQITFRQLAPLQTFTVTAGAAQNPVINFALSGITGAGTMAALFDFYKVDAIRLTARPNNNAIGLVAPATTTLVPLYWVIDYNDSSPLTGSAQALEYDNCMVLSPGESGERAFRPMYNMVAQSSAGTDYLSRSGDWLATGYDDILHYGCKFHIPAGAVGQTTLQTWTIGIEYFLTFRQVS